MRPADIEKLVSVSRPTLAPDGSFAIFATSRPDITANRGVGQLWRAEFPDRADSDTDAPARRLTRGVADSAPELSPDGALVAFLRPDLRSHAQLWVVASAGGEAVQVTDQPLGVGEFAWSPNGETIAFTAGVPERGRYGSVEGLEASAEAPRRITTVRWHANGLGFSTDRPAHLFTVPAPDVTAEPAYAAAAAVLPEGEDPPVPLVVPAAATQLTDGAAPHAGVTFTRDGAELITVVDVFEHHRRDLRSRLVAVRIDRAGERDLLPASANLAVADVAVADDGSIAVLGYDAGSEGVDFVAPGVALWLLEDGVPRRLTDPDRYDLGEVDSHITSLGDDFLVQHRTRGRVELLRVTRDGSATVLRNGTEVNGHDAVVTDDGGERIVVAEASATSFGALVMLDGPTLDFGEPLRAAGLVAPVELTIVGRDGYPVHGWVARPESSGPHPVILMIHGGPFAQYGIHPFDEVQTLVDAGYAVVYANPRGSAGYGRAHGRSIRGAMGTLDHADVIDFLEGAIASDESLDADRVGIMGGSYGGYLTAWIIAHDHRFAAAIVERGFLDPVSFQGTSDIGSFFGDEYVGTDAAAIAAQSPMAVVGLVTTPTLVVHSELDFRCPLEQATRYYSALVRGGVDAELLVFPGENHELTRSGQPRHRIERFDAVLDWWARHLPVA